MILVFMGTVVRQVLVLPHPVMLPFAELRFLTRNIGQLAHHLMLEESFIPGASCWLSTCEAF